jgi:hypothetical protein
MKVTYQAPRLSATFEGANQKELFKQLAGFQEVFDQSKCGKCGCDDIKFVVRTVSDNDYYELRCTSGPCRAKLEFGVNKVGDTLFPKRKSKEGEWLPDQGWTKWNAATSKNE